MNRSVASCRVKRVVLGAGITVAALVGIAEASSMLGYSNDFDGAESFGPGIGGGFGGVVTTESVQGYDGIGPAGNAFGGLFLRNTSPGTSAAASTLTLTGLPPHTSIEVNFLLAIIDSWDGVPNAFGVGDDTFVVEVDGTTLFSEVFENAGGSQTYVSPAGGELVDEVHMGFSPNNNEYHTDSAFNMYIEPTFDYIPHTGSTLTIDFFATSPNLGAWQGGDDESWAIENVEVLFNNVTPAPGAVWCVLGLPLLAGSRITGRMVRR